MTEPYPSTEVESKLKHLFRSLTRAHRAYKDTRNHALTLLHRASAAVLTAVLVYKVLTYLLFLPAMNGIWSLTLHCSPVNYLTNNNAHQIFTSPTILGGIVLIVLLAACWNLYGFSILLHGFALARRGETLRPVSLFVRSLGDIRHVLLPKNWPILLYCALLIPFTDVFVAYNYISQLAVPEYILGLVRVKPLYLVLFLLILGAAFLFTLFWVLVLPLFTLERKNLWEAVQESAAHVKTQLPRLAGVLLRWNLSALVRSVLVFFGASLLVYSVAALIGLRSTRAMLLLAVLEKRGGMSVAGCDAYINVVGGLQLDETAADLATLLAVASSWKDVAIGSDLAAVGEVGLSGEVRSVTQLGHRLSEIARLGIRRCIIPAHVKGEVPKPKGLELISVKNVREAIREALG